MIINEHKPDAVDKWYELSGVVYTENIGPKVNWDVKSAAKIITQAVGKKKIRELHKSNHLIDFSLMVLAFGLFIGSWYALATLPFGWVWIPLAIIQAATLNNLFYAIRHDAFHHRQVGGAKVSYILGIIMSIPMMNTYTRFLRHTDHHVHVGFDLFEEHIAEMDTVPKRWFGMTYPGLIFLFMGKLKTKGTPYPNKNWEDPAVLKKAKKIEGSLQAIWILTLLVLSFFWPYEIIMAYLLPYGIFGPIILSVKNALQHSETDPNNPLHASVYIKSNFFLRLFYCNSTGDLHLVHHIFPRIPFWRAKKAAKLFRPTLLANGVPERKLLTVLKSYYIVGRPYRRKWDMD